MSEETKSQDQCVENVAEEPKQAKPAGPPFYRYTFPITLRRAWDRKNGGGVPAPKSIGIRETTISDENDIGLLVTRNPEMSFSRELLKSCVVEIDGQKCDGNPNIVDEFFENATPKHREFTSGIWARLNTVVPEELDAFFATEEHVFG